MTPPIYHHNENDTRHWSPERAAAYAYDLRRQELRRELDCTPEETQHYAVIDAELDRISALTPLEYAAEIAAKEQAEANKFCAEVVKWADEKDASPDTLAAGLDAAGFGSSGPY